MNIKRIISITAVICLALSQLTACGSGEETGRKALSQCVVASSARKSAETSREKKAQETADSKDSAEEAGKSTVEESQGTTSGEIMPDLNSFKAQTAEGKTFTEKDFAAYDITVINIWQTTCGPCLAEMPALAEISAQLPDNVRLMSWCVDGEGQAEAVKDICGEAGFKAPVLISGDGDLMTLYQSLMYTPTTVAVDAEGNMVTEAMIGAPQHTEAAYRNYINQALEAVGADLLQGT